MDDLLPVLLLVAAVTAVLYRLLRRSGGPAWPWVHPPLYGAVDRPDRDRSRQAAELAAVAAYAEWAMVPESSVVSVQPVQF